MEAEERIKKKRKLSKTGIDPLESMDSSQQQDSPHDRSESLADQPYETSNIKRDISLKTIDICETPNDQLIPQENMEPLNETANHIDYDLHGAGLADGVVDTELPPPGEIAPGADLLNEDQPGGAMSKSQQKKLRKKLEWDSKREERKAIRKEKIVAKRERRREERNRRVAENPGEYTPPPVLKRQRKQKSVQLPVTILIDCDFDDLMRESERVSLGVQVTRSYSDNRNAVFRPHLAVCSFGGKLKERFDNVLSHYKNWKEVRFLDCNFVEASERAREWMLDGSRPDKLAGAFSALAHENDEAQSQLKDEGEVVYLTSEAEHTLTELKPYSTYIIGGLVDKNREKGICYKRATKAGVRTARLPIGDFMEMQGRKVLATNHVNEIMVHWLECGDWGEAFVKVIPKRKGGRLKGGNGARDASEEAERDAENGQAEDEGNGDDLEEFMKEAGDQDGESTAEDL